MEYRSRRGMRLAEFDYARAGAYFVTICAERQRWLFGEVIDTRMKLSSAGEVVARCWAEISNHFAGVVQDAFVIMPNHVHGILVFTEERDGHARPLQVVVGSFKSAVSRAIGQGVWQRSYWERVIRSEDELNGIRATSTTIRRKWSVL